MILPVNLGANAYDVVIERGCLARAMTLEELRARCVACFGEGRA